MPRVSAGPKLVLFGPDDKYGATQKRGFTEYVWYIRWYEGGAKLERSTGHERLEQAEARKVLLDFLNEQAAATAPAPDGPREPHELPIAECLSLYATAMEEVNKNPETPKNLERIGYAIDAILGVFGEGMVSSITAASCLQYAKTRGVSPATVRRELVVLRAAQNHCVKFSHLTRAQPMDLPIVQDGKKPFLRRNEAAQLLRAARNEPRSRRHLADFVVFGLYMGTRKGAELDVQWYPNKTAGYVDLEGNFIDFLGERTQTKKRRPTSTIPRRLRHFLSHWKLKRKRYVIEEDGQKLADIKRSFSSACRTAARAFYRKAMAAKAESNMKDWRSHMQSAVRLRQATPHVLRHTCITWLLQQGVPPWQVGGHVGDTAATIERVYGHHCPNHMKEITDAHRVGSRDVNRDVGVKLRAVAQKT